MTRTLLALAVLLLAACSSQVAPSQPNGQLALGASLGGSSSIRLDRSTAACTPRVQAPARVSANQGGSGGGVGIYYEVDNDGNVNIEVERLNASSGLWEKAGAFAVYPPEFYGNFRPKNNGTHRTRVQQAGKCNGDFSDWVLFGVEGMKDPEHNPVKTYHHHD